MKRFQWPIVCIVIVARIAAVSLFWLAGPLTGIFSYIFFDWLDGPLYKHLVHLPSEVAQRIDKSLDLWAYVFAMWYAYTTRVWFYPILLVFFVLRLIGQILFLVTEKRIYLIIFPNLFEVCFILFYLLDRYGIHDWSAITNHLILFVPLFAVLISLKIFHEYSLHRRGWTAFDCWWAPLLKRVAGLTS